LVKDEERCKIMAANIKVLAMPEATKAIVDEVEKLIK
jgi:UDP-N-acetylglucosamine:LPS N-acetylglucosamine transferase